MVSSKPIFFDPSGKRRQIARLTLFSVLAACIALAVIGEVVFLASPLVSRPKMRGPLENHAFTKLATRDLSPELIEKSRDALVREIQETKAIARRHTPSTYNANTVGFISSIDENSLALIRAHAEKLTAISPAWLVIDYETGHLSEALFSPESNPLNGELISIANERSLPIIPRISGYNLPPAPASNALTPDASKAAALEIADFLEREEFPGVYLELPASTQREQSAYKALIEPLAEACHAKNKFIGIVSYVDDFTPPGSAATSIDSVVLVNVSRAIAKGPVGSIAMFSDKVQSLLNVFPAEKISVAFASAANRIYASNPDRNERTTFPDAMLQADASAIRFDPTSATSSYSSSSAEDGLVTVWFADAAFSYNCKKVAESGSLASFGVWNVGTEDGAVWELLSSQPSLAELSHISPPTSLSAHGKGDILSVGMSGTAEGARKITLDEQTGLITKVTYESIPTNPTTLRSGFKKKKIVLTFDDGPAEPFTGQILDILKENGVKAAFFVTGEHVLEYPEIVRRIYDEGHEIGNHSFSHPDLSLVTKHRTTLELNATQRALQSALGRSVVLFRPPYISETSPLSTQEFRVLSIAQELGYATVGIATNGRDWVRYDTGQDGVEFERTGQDIANEILSKVDLMAGNTILLHDGPKEREHSVEAVALLIPRLKARGFSFTAIHELMGVSRDSLFPTMTSGSWHLLYQTLLQVVAYSSDIFSAIFIVVVVLSVARLSLILVCAILARIQELKDKHTPDDLELARDTSVSIIIAAYNEEKVIAQTLNSLLKGNHRAFEIIVVDDGSTDQTSAVVESQFAHDSRVTLLRKANGGKSEALNLGIESAQHQILVCLDADTQFDPDAVTYLARHFVDPEVGGVAGNIKVGNRRSILTHWQSMEYITNISIGRRAFGYLNAIMVVAGAAGAWRRSALTQAGGYHSDSLAEDMDVTWRVRCLNWRVINEPLAIGYTEAPEDIRGLYKQRFRWSYGALQCTWKHRSAIGKHGFFGWFGIPSIVLFGSAFELLAPLADLKMLMAVISFFGLISSGHPIHPGSLEYDTIVTPMITTGVLYVIFFGVELLISIIAFRFDGEDMRPLWLLFFQRFAYRQLMYFVACRSIWKALTGWRQGWGTLKRTGSVAVPS